MARIQKLTRNGVIYLYVVEDDYSSGNRKIHTIKSFGPYTPEKIIEAEMFLVNYNKLDQMAKLKIKTGETNESLTDALKLGGYLVLGLLGAAGLKYLIDKYSDENNR